MCIYLRILSKKKKENAPFPVVLTVGEIVDVQPVDATVLDILPLEPHDARIRIAGSVFANISFFSSELPKRDGEWITSDSNLRLCPRVFNAPFRTARRDVQGEKSAQNRVPRPEIANEENEKKINEKKSMKK